MMKKNYKKYFDFNFFKYIENNKNETLLSPSSSSSSSSFQSKQSESLWSAILSEKQDLKEENEKMNQKNAEMNENPILTIDEIVDCIIKYVQQSELYNLTYWDRMSTFMLKNIITNIHNHNEKEYIKDLIMYKEYQDVCKPEIVKYGMFKHKYFNLMIRIDTVDDQIMGEHVVSSTLMKKYENKYKEIIRLGLVVPVYCHIKMSRPNLFYSVQPFITNAITFDRWIEKIKHKSNFDEIVYDVFIQLSATLKELHELDCVHGDIKPANILVVEKPHVSVFLIDFGLSGIHEKSGNASGGTLPFCAPETYNTIANTRSGNNAIKYPQHFEYNWIKHNKSHDIWSIGFIFMTVYIFKCVKLFYHEYPADFFLPSGYISPNYLCTVKHEYIRDIFSEHILVEPSKRCDILKLNELILNLSFM
jgi:serine/threonine protein kinase